MASCSIRSTARVAPFGSASDHRSLPLQVGRTGGRPVGESPQVQSGGCQHCAFGAGTARGAVQTPSQSCCFLPYSAQAKLAVGVIFECPSSGRRSQAFVSRLDDFLLFKQGAEEKPGGSYLPQAQRGTLERLEAIALKLEAITLRLEAITLRLEAMALRLEAIALRFQAISLSLEAMAQRSVAMALTLETIASRSSSWEFYC